MQPERKVALMTGTLVAAAIGLGIALLDRPSPLGLDLHWWQLAVAFCVAEMAVAHIEIRKETVTLSLGESVLMVALMTISPAGVIAARTLGGGAALVLRRTTLQKFSFNLALFAAEAAIAGTMLHLAFGIRPDGPTLWATGGVSVLVAVLFSVGAVAVVISFFDANRPIGLLSSALAVQTIIAIASISLAIVGVAAVTAAPQNLIYLSVLLIGILLLLKRDAATAQRASDLAAIGQFTAMLVGLTRTTAVTETSLREIARTLRANRAAIMMPRSSGVMTQTYRLDTDDTDLSIDFDFAPLIDKVTEATLIERVSRRGQLVLPDGVAAPIAVGRERGIIVAWDRSTNVGGQFLPRDPRTLASMVDQVHVALARAALIDQLHFDAHHDALTELPNRLGFSEHLAAHGELIGALFVLDLDRFKDINDTLGHPTGDRVLQIIARRLLTTIGEHATLARLGGDEFAVFDRTASEGPAATAFAEKLVAAIEAPVKLEDLSLHIGASIGIALAPAHGDNLTVLMSHADTAMYEAKGRQVGWQFYRHETDTNDPRRLELVAELRKAIENRELEVWYQPRIDLKDRSVVGAEALARWNHDRFGFVPPDEFIGLAEGAGLMRELTNVILERTISDIRSWEEEGIELQVSVNLSTRNLLDDSLPERVDQLLKKNYLTPDRISFEITETAIMVDRERVIGLLGDFHALGIALAIDDYGTGYSSLAYLRELPVDELKIDRSFITNVDFEPHNEVIVRSTIEMAHNLGLVVIAEGIEREEEFAMLKSLGCDFGQGYLMSKPLPIEMFKSWLNVPPKPSSITDSRLCDHLGPRSLT